MRNLPRVLIWSGVCTTLMALFVVVIAPLAE